MITNNLDLRIMFKEKNVMEKSVAEFLQVTPMTISRWLNTSNLKPEKREKIIFAINYLYQLKESGRNRNTGRVQA